MSQSNGHANGHDYRLTECERRIFEVLADGWPHSKAEIVEATDSQGAEGTLVVYIHRLRKKLERKGTTIVCLNGGRCKAPVYRYVRLISPSAE